MDWATLTQPFSFAFMQNAFVIAGLVAVPMALLSVFLVLRGWSLLGDAVSHAVLPGVVLAYVIGLPLAVGAFFAGMVCAVGAGYLSDNSRVREDTILGVVFSGMFGLGIVLYRKVETAVHLNHILFGNMLGVNPTDLLVSLVIAVTVSLLVLAFRRDLMAQIFDTQHARAVGVHTRLMHYGLLAMVSVAIVAALKAIGIILSIALLIAPGAIAFLLTNRFERMLVIAVTVSVACSVVGVYLSFFIDSAPAPTIVLLMTLIFVIAFVVKSLQVRAKVGHV